MNLLDRLTYAYWIASGRVAFLKRNYGRALDCFDRAARKRTARPLLLGYRAQTLLLKGPKGNARAAFEALAAAKETNNPDDEYARLYGRMFVALVIAGDREGADRLAVQMKAIRHNRSVDRILFPIERPSAILSDCSAASDRSFDVEAVIAHVRSIQSSYSVKPVTFRQRL